MRKTFRGPILSIHISSHTQRIVIVINKNEFEMAGLNTLDASQGATEVWPSIFDVYFTTTASHSHALYGHVLSSHVTCFLRMNEVNASRH